jgi:hypothetical protein
VIRYIKTKCIDCGKGGCDKKPAEYWISETEGCEREVSGLMANKYYHYMVEVKPMLLRRKQFNKDAALWKEITDFLEEFEALPAGRRFKNG